jgi:hypothetical protein
MNQPRQLIRWLKQVGFVFLLVMLATGCTALRGKPNAAAFEVGNAHLAYLQSEPHRRLYVEVDAVEGTEFSPAELAELESMLRKWTQKPDGIAVMPSSSIPRSAARGHSAESLTRQYLDGPPAGADDSSCAYLYLLVYDSRINRNPLQSPRAASSVSVRDKVPTKLATPENPHVVFFPYPAMIYVDRSWLGGLLPRKYWERTLLHEAGHILGLVGRESRDRTRHCPTNWCLMQARVSENIKSDIVNWLRQEEPKPYLCEACAAELRQYQTSTETDPARFVGPVLVRKMPSYHVLALPAFCGLFIGEGVDANIPGFIEEFRRLEGQKGFWFATLVQDNLDRESLLQGIEAAKQDFDPTVRKTAHELERKVRENEVR